MNIFFIPVGFFYFMLATVALQCFFPSKTLANCVSDLHQKIEMLRPILDSQVGIQTSTTLKGMVDKLTSIPTDKRDEKVIQLCHELNLVLEGIEKKQLEGGLLQTRLKEVSHQISSLSDSTSAKTSCTPSSTPDCRSGITLAADLQTLRPRVARRRPHPETQLEDFKSNPDPNKMADMSIYPQAKKRSPNDEITLGDLHGNALKLAYFLVREGIMNMSESDYRQLREIYYQGGFEGTGLVDSSALSRYESILSRATISPQAPFVRLLGDEMSDRGRNDYFTLLLLEKLASHRHEGKPHFEILLSNHSLNFIYQMQKNQNPLDRLSAGQENSRERLAEMMTKSGEVRERAQAIFQTVYLPNLKLLSYSTENTPDTHYDKELTLYSHAPMGLEGIKMLAQHYKIPICDTRISTESTVLTRCVDAINRHFGTHIHEFSSEYEREHAAGGLSVSSREPANYRMKKNLVFSHITWNRNGADLERPEFIGDHAVTFVHGHEGFGEKIIGTGHTFNIDNDLGKDDTDASSKHRMIATQWGREQQPPQSPHAFWEASRPPHQAYLGRYNYYLSKREH